jgi:ppGpp synthetase/RelA/SpoT-type nucleotidyltranferase
MDLVGEFVRSYGRELDYYASAARLVQQQLDAALRQNGIRGITTSRAKRPDSVEKKLRKRASEGRVYADLDSIRSDLGDLAGVRVALYFPDERDKVNALITGLFRSAEPVREHPNGSPKPIKTTDGEEYTKRFGGYAATHHRVLLKEDMMSDEDRRLTAAPVEVQVGSVLMHAWAEVEHDLVYKPLSGILSRDELSILDEINGLTIAGEIALGRLQDARDRRIETQVGPFDSLYDLASYLHEHVKRTFATDASREAMGDADKLFALLGRAGLNSREALSPLLDELKPDFERRPIAEQVIDKIIAGDKVLYEWIQEQSIVSPYTRVPADAGYLARGRFLDHWAALEGCLANVDRDRARSRPGPAEAARRVGALVDRRLLPGEAEAAFQDLRRLRNATVHGGARDFAPDVFEDATRRVDRLLAAMAASTDPEVSAAGREALDSVGRDYRGPPAVITP